MRLSPPWLAALMAATVSAPCLGDDASQAAIPQPQSHCNQGPGQCYSKPELTNVAGAIAKKDDDVSFIKAVLTNPSPPNADVHYPDVQGVAGYFQDLQGVGEGVEQALIKYGHYSPDQAAAMLKQPAQARAAIQKLIQSGQLPNAYLNQDLKPPWMSSRDAMQQIVAGKGPYAMTLNNPKINPLAPMMNKPLGTGSDALPPVTTPSQLQQSQPQNPDAYLDGAQAAAADGDIQGAANQASQALAIDPNNLQALDIRGAANYQLGNKDDARADATKALKIDPKDQTASAILNLGDHVDGSAGIKPPADPFGANPAGIGSLPGGVASNARWNDRESGSASAKGSAADPRAAALLRDAVGSLSMGDSAAAERTLGKVIALDPANVDALNMRALALARQRRYGEALRDAEAVLKLDPKNRTAMDMRAVALNKLKRFSDAAAQARAAIEVNPNDGAAYRNLAEALAGLGDRAGSLAALKKAAELDSRFEGTLDAALQLPADADLNLLFADDGPAAAAVDAARAARSSRRPWNMKVLGAAALAGAALLLIGLWSSIGGGLERFWRKVTRERVVRASEVRYVVESRPEEPLESKPGGDA